MLILRLLNRGKNRLSTFRRPEPSLADLCKMHKEEILDEACRIIHSILASHSRGLQGEVRTVYVTPETISSDPANSTISIVDSWLLLR